MTKNDMNTDREAILEVSPVDLGLGPLPEAAMKGGPGQMTRRDYFSADQMHAFALQERAAERERWQRIADAAQAVTTGSNDRIEIFRVPSHLMAALALALDEGPNVRGKAGDAVLRGDSP